MLCLCGLQSTHTCTCIINMHIMWTKFQKGYFYCKINKVSIISLAFLSGVQGRICPTPLENFCPLHLGILIKKNNDA